MSPLRRNRGVVLLAAGVVTIVVAMIGAAALALTGSPSGSEEPPVRVLLVGDSIMNQAGLYLEEALEARPGVEDVEVVNEARNGTGLLTPQVFDWKGAAPDLIATTEPDVIIVLFVGNYASTDLWVNQGGVEVEGYTPQFFQAWEGEARALHRLLAESGADVYWVNPPPMLGEEGEYRVREFRQINRRLAEDFTGVVLIDGTDALSDGEGGYAFELPGEDGIPEQVRSLDSVHLTPAGAERLADELARQVTTSIRVAQLDGDSAGS